MQLDLELLDNLLGRIESSPRGSGYTLEGLITQREYEALSRIVSYMRSNSTDGSTPLIASPRIVSKASLEKRSLSAKVDDTTILCLDFGTAFSKAAATDATERLIEIDLNYHAQTEGQSYLLDSSIFIDNNRVWFGAHALEQSNSIDDIGRCRFDSPKQEMSQGDLKLLDSQPVDRSINPSSVRFSKGDLIQLYLGYLIDCTSSQLIAQGITDLPKQRFARPCWPEERARAADIAFRKMLARGQVIADTLRSDWAEGVSVITARGVLDAANTLDVPAHHIEPGGVMEASASASAALRGLPSEAIFLVVDIGAGTCDFGLFFVRDGRRIAELDGTAEVLRQAGDKVDELLVNALLEKAHIASGSDEARRMRQDLASDRRRLKQTLFVTDHVTRTLQNDATVDISREEFSSRSDVLGLVDSFRAKLMKCLSAPIPRTYERTAGNIDVVLTGGGARLPFFRSVFDAPLMVGGHGQITFNVRESAPSWIAAYPRIQPYFPQLAVAIGGAQEYLPAQRAAVTDITPVDRGPRTMGPNYKS